MRRRNALGVGRARSLLLPIFNKVLLRSDGDYIRYGLTVAASYAKGLRFDHFQRLLFAYSTNRNGKIAFRTHKQKDVYVLIRQWIVPGYKVIPS